MYDCLYIPTEIDNDIVLRWRWLKLNSGYTIVQLDVLDSVWNSLIPHSGNNIRWSLYFDKRTLNETNV